MKNYYAIKFEMTDIMREARILADIVLEGGRFERRGRYNLCYGISKNLYNEIVRYSNRYYAL